MAQGPGKYDDLCTYVRETTNAQAAMVIVVQGNDGQGFSVQGSRQVLEMLPKILRQAADQMEAEVNRVIAGTTYD